MSAFVWLDYSERERRKMLDVVDLFREHDTVGSPRIRGLWFGNISLAAKWVLPVWRAL